MGRKATGPWYREGRGWYATVNGRQVALGVTKKRAKSAAIDAWRELVGRVSKGTIVVPESLGEVFGMFMDHIQATTPKSYDWYRRYLLRFVAWIGDDSMPPGQITAKQITDWLAADYAGKTTRAPMRAVKAALRWAASPARRFVTESPIQEIPLPRETRRANQITPEQQQAIRKYVGDDPFGLVLDVLGSTGARITEIREIEARHYRADLRAWVIPRNERKRGDVMREPRVIPIPSSMVAMVERLNAERPEGPILVNTRGMPWTKSAIVQRFDRIREKIEGMPPNLCATHYRHAMAMRLVRTTDIETARQVLGHSSYDMLLEHYLHPGHVEELRSAIEKTHGDAQPPERSQSEPGESASPPEPDNPP